MELNLSLQYPVDTSTLLQTQGLRGLEELLLEAGTGELQLPLQMELNL